MTPKSTIATKIAVIGGGSWATALIKILSENDVRINWWIRNTEDVKHIKKFHHNPRYLSNIDLNLKKVNPGSDLLGALQDVSIIILAVPAAFIKGILADLKDEDLQNKVIISAIKGMVPNDNLLITDLLEKDYKVAKQNLCVIAGPCHSEEIAMEKKSYLTIAGNDQEVSERIAKLLTCRFVKTSVIKDLYGIEYCAVMKNIIAIACGLAHGLGYGDNFQAVLVSNAMQEIKRFLEKAYPLERDLNASAYLGDLLVTSYSQFSRNRTLGSMVGRGYSVKSAQIEMNMVAEGYYAVKCVHDLNKTMALEMPITKAVYNVLYERISPMVEMKILENTMK